MGSEWLWQGRDRREERLSLSLLCEAGGGVQCDQDLDVVMLEVRTVECAWRLWLISLLLSVSREKSSQWNKQPADNHQRNWPALLLSACLVIFYLLIIHHQHSHYHGAFLVTWKFKFLTLIKMKCIFNFRWADGTFGQESVGQFMSSLVFLFCS